MEVRSGGGYPSSVLTNFAGHPFVLDEVHIASMEGLLQALKFDKEHIQVEVCKLGGMAAKRRGAARNSAWKRVQLLWWKGVAMRRDSAEYQTFLDRAYDAMYSQSPSFRDALFAAGPSAVFTHSIGKSRVSDTVLT
jgi:hypothetical protein